MVNRMVPVRWAYELWVMRDNGSTRCKSSSEDTSLSRTRNRFARGYGLKLKTVQSRPFRYQLFKTPHLQYPTEVLAPTSTCHYPHFLHVAKFIPRFYIPKDIKATEENQIVGKAGMKKNPTTLQKIPGHSMFELLVSWRKI